MHDGLVDVGIERDPGLSDHLQALLLECLHQLRLQRPYLLVPMAERCVERVENDQEFANQVQRCLRPLVRPLGLDPTLVVLVVGLQAAKMVQVVVALGLEPLGELHRFGHRLLR